MSSYANLTRVTVGLHCLFLSTILFVSWGLEADLTNFASVILYISIVCFGLFALSWNRRCKEHWQRFTEQSAIWQQRSLESFDEKYIGLLIGLSAGLSLFFELALIRWQGSIFPVFAFYKNFTLLACFVGLGLGYARSDPRQGVLAHCLVLLAIQILFFMLLRYLGSDVARLLVASPVLEQSNMGLARWNQFNLTHERLISVFAVYGFLGLSFVMTVLIMFPIGQLCGHFVDRRPRLEAYGKNLLGSLLGVVLFFAVSYFWTPPAIWFAAIVFALMFFQSENRHSRWVILTSAFLVVCVLAWPVNPLLQRLYSPYQVIEKGTVGGTGLMQIMAAGTYFQRVHNFSPSLQSALDDEQRSVLNYYDLPFQFQKAPANVAVVGSGSGNDVAAALRAGAARVDAIEIDPVIVALGRANHPESPYGDPKVNIVVNDARTFFRTTDRRYDAIVYGVLDSHAQLSHGSNVRLDSFVYTTEGLRESFRRLKKDGILSLSFAFINQAQVYRIFEMLRLAAMGREPMVVGTGYDARSTFTFLVRKGGEAGLDNGIVARAGFEVITAEYRNPPEAVDIPTDDWPFFYMTKRVYPLSYVLTLLFMMALTVSLSRRLVAATALSTSLLSFFFLGAGFMLIETKAITEFGLLFGNTWHVVGVIISAILLMAYLGNALVEKLRLSLTWWAYGGLFAVISLGYFATGEQLDIDYQLLRILALILLTAPIFFSGIIFSTQLRGSRHPVSEVMAYNIMGAMFGGLLEYNSMYFGFSFLYLLAIVLYSLAWWLSRSREPRLRQTSGFAQGASGLPPRPGVAVKEHYRE